MPLDTRGVHQFDELDSETTFSELLNLGMGSVSAALKYLSGPAAAREAIAPAPTGMLWRDTDGSELLHSVDDLGNWRQQEGVIPLNFTAWSTSANGIYSYTGWLTFPVRLAPDEFIAVEAGHAMSYMALHSGDIERLASTTRVGVNLTQFHSNNIRKPHCQVSWRIVRQPK